MTTLELALSALVGALDRAERQQLQLTLNASPGGANTGAPASRIAALRAAAVLLMGVASDDERQMKKRPPDPEAAKRRR